MKKALDAIIICSSPGPSKSIIVHGIIDELSLVHSFSSHRTLLYEGYRESVQTKDFLDDLSNEIQKAKSNSNTLIYGTTLDVLAKAKYKIQSAGYKTVNVFVEYSQNEIKKYAESRHFHPVHTQRCIDDIAKQRAILDHPSNQKMFDVVVNASMDEKYLEKIIEAVQSKVYCDCVTY